MGSGPNILFIMCDAIRKDILEVYGGPAKSPSMKRLAQDSMVYQNAIASATWTLPSHVSLFTGLYPGQHGIHEFGGKFDAVGVMAKSRELKVERLPQKLSKIGYHTSCISNNPWTSSETGFEIGFEKFTLLDNQPQWIMDGIIQASYLGSSIPEILGKLIAKGDFKKIAEYGNVYGSKMLYDFTHNFPMDKGARLTTETMKKEKLDDKFFKFINYVEPHEPFRGEGDRERWGAMLGFQKQSLERAAALKKEYLLEITYLDREIGRVIEILKKQGVYDDTMIIVTADHGQEFMEHGYMYHGIYVHEEIARIPLIVKYPKGKKFQEKKGYQSLNSLNGLMKSIAEGGDDECLTTSTAMCEAYGFPHVTPPRYTDQKIDEEHTKTRVAIYEDGCKLTYNVTDDKPEELLQDGKTLELTSNSAKVKDMFGVWQSMMSVSSQQGINYEYL
jgi:arylsulfatase A-like enzyme